MSVRIKMIILLAIVVTDYSPCLDVPEKEVLQFYGLSDASAAVPASGGLFVAAEDETNNLMIYDSNRPGRAIGMFDLNPFLSVDQQYPESDIEGGALIGSCAYWITSHGRNKDGKLRPSRYRFFATEIVKRGDTIAILPVGQPCITLLQAMIAMDDAGKLGLSRAARLDDKLNKMQREELAPKRDGINIEGLCASADGKSLYIGFRNPLVRNEITGRKEALVFRLLNPDEVIKNSAAPSFEQPLLWDLDKRGIGGMTYVPLLQSYLILAGPVDGKGDFMLHRWSGDEAQSPYMVKVLDNIDHFSPETLIVFNDSGKMLVISDDGSLAVKVAGAQECMAGMLQKDGTCLNKYLVDRNKRTFRGIWLELPAGSQQ
jgi:hypothetical protein